MTELLTSYSLLAGCLWGLTTVAVLYAYVALLYVYRVAFTEFTVFQSPWFFLHKTIISPVQFRFGWLPNGGYVQITGLNETPAEQQALPPVQRPYALFTKPPYVKYLLKLAQPLTHLLVMALVLLALFPVNRVASQAGLLLQALTYVPGILLGIDPPADEFTQLLGSFSSREQLPLGVFFVLSLTSVVLFTSADLLALVMDKLGISRQKQNPLLVAIALLYYFFVLLRIPLFIASQVEEGQFLPLLTSFLAGLYVSAGALYGAAIVIFTYLPKLGQATPLPPPVEERIR